MYKQLKKEFKKNIVTKEDISDVSREEMLVFIRFFISKFHDGYGGKFKSFKKDKIVSVFNPYANYMTGMAMFFPDSINQKKITKIRISTLYFLTESGNIVIRDNYYNYYSLEKCDDFSIKNIYISLGKANYIISKQILKQLKKDG